MECYYHTLHSRRLNARLIFFFLENEIEKRALHKKDVSFIRELWLQKKKMGHKMAALLFERHSVSISEQQVFFCV